MDWKLRVLFLCLASVAMVDLVWVTASGWFTAEVLVAQGMFVFGTVFGWLMRALGDAIDDAAAVEHVVVRTLRR